MKKLHLMIIDSFLLTIVLTTISKYNKTFIKSSLKKYNEYKYLSNTLNINNNFNSFLINGKIPFYFNDIELRRE
jgi:hypothetical protein